MTSFYSRDELNKIGFERLGDDVFISRKASIYSPEKMKIGNHVRIDDFCILSGKIELGNYIHVAAYSAIYGGEAGVIVSNFANISSRVSIYSVSDDYSGETMTSPMIPKEYKNVDSREVIIKEHVIIGSNSVVMPGTTLNTGSAFGAFSFINRDTEEWSIYAGIPIKKVKDRERDLLKFEKNLLQE